MQNTVKYIVDLKSILTGKSNVQPKQTTEHTPEDMAGN